MNVKKIFGGHYRRLLAESALRSAIFGAGVGFAVGGVLAAIYWLVGIGVAWLGAAVGLPVGIVAGVLAYFLRYRLTEKELAARIDRHGLEERMITMLELGSESTDIAVLQRRDAEASLAALPERSIRPRASALLVAVFAMTVAVSLFFGVLAILAHSGSIPYGKDFFLEGADGTLEVSYTTEGGGYVKGEAKQTVAFGEDSQAVRAVAEDGWRFVRWSDGVRSPERREESVTSDISVKAIFARINLSSEDDEDGDEADDLPYADVIEESGGGGSDELGGDNIKDDGDGSGGGKWQDRNQFIDGMTYYRDYLEFYYQYATGIFESEGDIPEDIVKFFEMYFNGI